MNSSWGYYPEEKLPADVPAGRIISRNREVYMLADGNEIYNARVTGRMVYLAEETAELPVAGDWVTYEMHDDFVVIKEILPRFSVFSRKAAGVTTEEQPIAANINTVAIVFGLDGGRNYNSRALERYLTIAWNSGAQPLVILNKADLCEDPEAIKNEAEYTAPGVDVIVASAKTGEGVELIRSKVPSGSSIVFIGPSGVGKSALTNVLLGTEKQLTGETRESDKRGRHTTTSAVMIVIPGGGVLIDSPGLKEIQLWGEAESLDSVFEEISSLAAGCRFSDCSHQGEPGCSVQQALAVGTLDQTRYESYLELRKELAYLETKQNERARQEFRAKNKRFGKMVKNMKNGKVIY